jgi:hypothetical protein
MLLETFGEAAQRADAQRLSAAYDHDPDALYFEVCRRSAGSFTTTVAGSPAQRDRYWRAWEFAFDLRKGREAEAAKIAAE